MFCSKCGSEIKDGSNFCTKCGAKVDVPETNTVNTERINIDAVRIIPNNHDTQSMRGKKGKTGIIALSFVGIAVVAVVVVVIMKFAFGGKVSDDYSGQKESVGNEKADNEKKDDGKKDRGSAKSNKFEYELPESLSDDFFEPRTIEIDGESVELLTQIYRYESGSSYLDMSYTVALYFVRNTTDKTLYYHGEAYAYDENDNELYRSYFNFHAIAPGETVVDSICFNDTVGVAEVKFDNESCTANSGGVSLSKDMDIDAVRTNSGIALSIKNNTSYNASGVTQIIFFDEEGVPIESSQIIHGNGDILAGCEIADTLVINKAYKSAMIFKQVYTHESLNEKEFLDEENALSHHEYYYNGSFGDRECYSVVKNTTSGYISIYGNAIARDSEGNMVHANDSTLEYVAPGEEMVMTYVFGKNIDFDSVDITYLIRGIEDTDRGYNVKDVSIDVTKGENLVSLCCTNNGSVEAKRAMIKSLFFDENGKVIYVGLSGTISIVPGSSQTFELTAPAEYDHVENFFAYY